MQIRTAHRFIGLREKMNTSGAGIVDTAITHTQRQPDTAIVQDDPTDQSPTGQAHRRPHWTSTHWSPQLNTTRVPLCPTLDRSRVLLQKQQSLVETTVHGKVYTLSFEKPTVTLSVHEQ
ncbi:hypothetical protein Pcinc_008299 [Petrolisthes cinctipes]|uniref:Uncharacterized protein n=1 Tax=Petrolisthes cinctipes TaxID=88211 RepID=A0AAE1G7N1_PETCI|nr:hypothetical protein Pcinc_008299 [Petrolisthes cinctipes]